MAQLNHKPRYEEYKFMPSKHNTDDVKAINQIIKRGAVLYSASEYDTEDKKFILRISIGSARDIVHDFINRMMDQPGFELANKNAISRLRRTIDRYKRLRPK